VSEGIPLAVTGSPLRERLSRSPGGSVVRGGAAWLRGSRLGLVVMALVVGAGSASGAVGFRWLIVAVTWLATGYQQFGQQGRVASLHLPGLGFWFLLLIRWSADCSTAAGPALRP